MNISKFIQNGINKIPEGKTFKYRELDIPSEYYSAAAKALERFIKKGMIKRVSTGVFYKPIKSVFGELKPKEEELLKPYLFIGNKRIAYITGNTLYNRMGLTSQVSKNIKVASRKKRVITKVASIQVKPIKSYVDVTNSNYRFLELLDVMKDFKQIPDSNTSIIIDFLQNNLKKLDSKELNQIISMALMYPPRVRALLGALIDKLQLDTDTEKLKKSINPLTKFELGVKYDLGSLSEKWKLL